MNCHLNKPLQFILDGKKDVALNNSFNLIYKNIENSIKNKKFSKINNLYSELRKEYSELFVEINEDTFDDINNKMKKIRI